MAYLTVSLSSFIGTERSYHVPEVFHLEGPVGKGLYVVSFTGVRVGGVPISFLVCAILGAIGT